MIWKHHCQLTILFIGENEKALEYPGKIKPVMRQETEGMWNRKLRIDSLINYMPQK